MYLQAAILRDWLNEKRIDKAGHKIIALRILEKNLFSDLNI